MTALLKLIFRPESDSREASLAQCRKSKVEMEGAIWRHFEDAMAFKDSGAWKEEYPSWKACCEANRESLYSHSFYRTIASSLPIADMIEEITGVRPLEGQARKVNGLLNVVCAEDLELKAETYEAWHEETGELMPTEKQLQEAFGGLYQLKHQRIIEIEGESVTVGDVLSDNLRYGLNEVRKRKTAHISASMGIESKRADIRQKEAVLAFLDSMGIGYASELNPRDFAIVWKQDKP